MTIHRARRQPSHNGLAAWAEILGPGPDFPQLTDKATADVVVVGAGFAGLSAARRLKELDPALDVVLLDAGRIAEGAAGRNSGFMIDVPHELTSENYAGDHDKAQITLNRLAQAFGARAVEDFGIDSAYFDPMGKINGAASARADAHNAALAAHLTTLGEPSERLDASQMAEITGTHHYTSGLYTPGTVMLQPAGYVRGLSKGLAANGVRTYENSGVTGLDRVRGHWNITTKTGSVSAKNCILTVNGHLESFGFMTRRLMHVFLFAVMTPDLPAEALAGQSRWGITPSDPMGTTVRRIDAAQGGNRIVTRTCAVLRPGMTTSTSDLRRAARIMQDKFDARFPKLKGLKMEYTWAGHLCLARNGSSIMNEIDDGLFAGCVQNGLGTTRGTLTGIGAAELLLGHTSDVTRHFVDQPLPKRLPPQPFQQIGANAYLRLKEWQARSE